MRILEYSYQDSIDMNPQQLAQQGWVCEPARGRQGTRGGAGRDRVTESPGTGGSLVCKIRCENHRARGQIVLEDSVRTDTGEFGAHFDIQKRSFAVIFHAFLLPPQTQG